MKEIYFVRHGQTEWNALRRMQGQLNSNLNEIGKQQASVNGRFLSTQSVTRIYTSPLGRTRETTSIINAHTALPVVYEDRIKEWHCGDWSGAYWAHLARDWPTEWLDYETDRYNNRPPNSENYPDMLARVAPFLDMLMQSADEAVAVVSHGIIGRVMIAALLKLDARDTMSFRQANDVVYKLDVSRDAYELTHFVGGEGPLKGMVAVVE